MSLTEAPREADAEGGCVSTGWKRDPEIPDTVYVLRKDREIRLLHVVGVVREGCQGAEGCPDLCSEGLGSGL